MSPWLAQVLTLAGVAIGAVASFVSTRFLEHARWQRDETVRLGSKRLDCYGEFAVAMKRFVTTAHRIAASLGLPSSADPLDLTSGLPALAAAEQELGLRWEEMLMLGSPRTIVAARDWRDAARHLEWFARGHQTDPVEYRKAFDDSGELRQLYYKAVRADLGIVDGEIPEHRWPPAWRKSPTDTLPLGCAPSTTEPM